MYQSDCYNSNTMHWICHHCMAKPMHCFLLGQIQCTMWQTHCIVVCQNQCANTLHCDCIICQSYCIINMHVGPNPGGGFSNYFLTECAARGLPPLPISKDFVFTKKWMNIHFFRNFRKSRPISKRFIYLFFTLKMTDFTIFSQILWNGTSFKDIFDQSGTHA